MGKSVSGWLFWNVGYFTDSNVKTSQKKKIDKAEVINRKLRLIRLIRLHSISLQLSNEGLLSCFNFHDLLQLTSEFMNT